ncbi:MAG: GNAT family N-acetyltransferase, partial [Hyphomicrobiaceae bacterium]|nr:GNAT family N-acetyltransferase [Hyphomicrobiaceae bacterium]
MSALAELIELAFSENLDATGQNMVQNMRILGRLGWVGWLMGRLVLPSAANPKGFVWEEDGRVVGNASLLPVNRYPNRWVMANVVVRPEYRRQGIGKELVNASIDLVREYRGEIIILQADRDVPGVERMYENEGFESLS